MSDSLNNVLLANFLELFSKITFELCNIVKFQKLKMTLMADKFISINTPTLTKLSVVFSFMNFFKFYVLQLKGSYPYFASY